MRTSLLLLDYLPTPELKKQHTVTYVGLALGNYDDLADSVIAVDLATVQGQARVMDWIRQNTVPSRVKCRIDSPDFEGAASEFLQAKVVGVTRILEATLMLSASIHWEFIIDADADIWSKSCEAYFRALAEGLSTELPQAKITFV